MSSALSPLLRIENLTVDFGSNRVLSELSLSIRTGELVALIGPNGSGKTTLLRAAIGLIFCQGRIEWNGDGAAVRHPQQLARIASYLPQNPYDCPSIRE